MVSSEVAKARDTREGDAGTRDNCRIPGRAQCARWWPGRCPGVCASARTLSKHEFARMLEDGADNFLAFDAELFDAFCQMVGRTA